MIKHNLGYPRIGSRRELKKACEDFWSGKSTKKNLLQVGKNIRRENWLAQKEAGIELIPTNDFSFYDQVLDMSLSVGAIPERYSPVLASNKNNDELDLYFAMARGYQKDGLDITAMEMTKWFDTNYHYIVPEFVKNQEFALFSNKIINEFYEAKETLGAIPKPVLIGPVSYLLLGKEKEEGFDRLSLIDKLLPVYESILLKLEEMGAEWVQLDEPFLVMNLSPKAVEAYKKAYEYLKRKFPYLKFLIATYFEGIDNNIGLVQSMPLDALHLDLVRCPEQLDSLLNTPFLQSKACLSLGLIDGRNIWKNDYEKSLSFIKKAEAKIGKGRLMLAPSCSLLHVPYDLENEHQNQELSEEIKKWMAFAKQKLNELEDLFNLSNLSTELSGDEKLLQNKACMESRANSPIIHNEDAKRRLKSTSENDISRGSRYDDRKILQAETLKLPLLPSTTIGSFPQTQEIRKLRASFKNGSIGVDEYESRIKEEIKKVIQWQEEIGLDVLVHGEYERNDMVEYFGELLEGFAFTENGWVQSYGSRCVKPPVIYGDVFLRAPMTVKWAVYAQSLTKKFVKGMLTGPVTLLQWSFVRDDQPRKDTCFQLALAIKDEVEHLEKEGISIIQIDEPAYREGLPLRQEKWNEYLQWATQAFKIASGGVKDTTQIHTHMCYSEFNDIIQNIAEMDADVITIETSRSQMELLDAFVSFNYPNEIGPGVYDIHSPRTPSSDEMVALLQKALKVLPAENLWVNPDCGLKTRKWPETEAALKNMVEAAKQLRAIIKNKDEVIA